MSNYYINVDDVEYYSTTAEFDSANVLFTIYDGDDALLVGSFIVYYDDESTKEYIRDIKRILRNPDAVLHDENLDYLLIKNDGYGELAIQIENSFDYTKNLIKKVGEEI